MRLNRLAQNKLEPMIHEGGRISTGMFPKYGAFFERFTGEGASAGKRTREDSPRHSRIRLLQSRDKKLIINTAMIIYLHLLMTVKLTHVYDVQLMLNEIRTIRRRRDQSRLTPARVGLLSPRVSGRTLL